MKKPIAVLLVLALVLLAALSFAGCRHNDVDPEINIPSPEPTSEPTWLEPEVIEAFVGDWYGTYKVSEARGIYAQNDKVVNDCAMRVAVDNFGRGGCYLQVNGMGRDSVSGSSNVFALCTAEISGQELLINGMINTLPVEWRFKLEDGSLTLLEVYGDIDDHMRIEIELVRPDALVESGISVDAYAYLVNNGFADVVQMLGGVPSELPSIAVSDDIDPHIFFTGDGSMITPPDSPNTVTSYDGRIKVVLPEGYSVMQNNADGFVMTSAEDKVRSISFTVGESELDSLSYLIGSTENVTELYHYTIDRFDFYGTFTTAEQVNGTATGFKLCGTDGSGRLITVEIVLDLDSYNAYSYINVNNENFSELVLGAKFIMN